MSALKREHLAFLHALLGQVADLRFASSARSEDAILFDQVRIAVEAALASTGEDAMMRDAGKTAIVLEERHLNFLGDLLDLLADQPDSIVSLRNEAVQSDLLAAVTDARMRIHARRAWQEQRARVEALAQTLRSATPCRTFPLGDAEYRNQASLSLGPFTFPVSVPSAQAADAWDGWLASRDGALAGVAAHGLSARLDALEAESSRLNAELAEARLKLEASPKIEAGSFLGHLDAEARAVHEYLDARGAPAGPLPHRVRFVAEKQALNEPTEAV